LTVAEPGLEPSLPKKEKSIIVHAFAQHIEPHWGEVKYQAA